MPLTFRTMTLYFHSCMPFHVDVVSPFRNAHVHVSILVVETHYHAAEIQPNREPDCILGINALII